MPDINVRSDTVNVEQIMEQIRGRIREKRGVDFTEAQVRELATARLDQLLDPRGVRSELLEQFRRAQAAAAIHEYPNFTFEADTLYDSTRGPLRWIRRMLQPLLKLFFNPNPLIKALNIQSKLNVTIAEREAKRDTARLAFDQLQYDAMRSLVMETTRLGFEVKHLTMRVESLGARVEFNERRTRAVESTVVYGPPDEIAPRLEAPRAPRRDEGRRDDGRRDDARQNEGRRDDARREDGRRDEGRRDNERREEPRRDEPRRDDSRREDTRREARRSEQGPRPQPPAPPPAPPPQRSEIVIVADDAVADPSSGVEPGQPVTAGEGAAQKTRRRRRRRGRRGSGSAPSGSAGDPGAGGDTGSGVDLLDGVDHGGADSAADVDGAGRDDSDTERAATPQAHDHESEANTDSRTARPEPFEHTFGAQAHPAETATSDPTHTGTTPNPGRRDATPAEPTAANPSATPEQ